MLYIYDVELMTLWQCNTKIGYASRDQIIRFNFIMN